MSEITYIGVTNEAQESVIWKDEDGERTRLPINCHSGKNDQCNLLPTWGYGGHGPHDTAYSLLLDVLGEQHREKHESRNVAWKLANNLVRARVSRWQWLEGRSGEQWRITGGDLIGLLHSWGIHEAGSDWRWTGEAEMLLDDYPYSETILNAHCAGRNFYAQVRFLHEGSQIILRHEDDSRKLVPLYSFMLGDYEARREIVRLAMGFDSAIEAQEQVNAK